MSVGHYEGGRIGDIFVTNGDGSEMAMMIDDACVLVSVLLQHGYTPHSIYEMLGREGHARIKRSTTPSSVIGHIVRHLIHEEVRNI